MNKFSNIVFGHFFEHSALFAFRRDIKMMENKMNINLTKSITRNRFLYPEKKILLFVLLTIITVLFLGFFAFRSKAAASDHKENMYKYYTQIRIEYGDTLWSIADRYMDQNIYNKASYIAELKKINHIKDNGYIQEGKTLIIPYYSTEYITSK